MTCNDPAIHLSWQLLFILPMIADYQLVCGAAWNFTPSSVQALQYWSSRVPDGPDPNSTPPSNGGLLTPYSNNGLEPGAHTLGVGEPAGSQ